MSDKLLTVIVPSYNMEEYLPKCLGSLIVPDEAMLQRLDVIVVNAGSKDRTSEIAHDFEKRYPGVFRVIDKANGNYGSCINAALPIATGFYVKILDADDTFCQVEFHRYLKFLALLSDEGSPDVVVNDFVVVDNDGNETERHCFGTDGDTSFALSCIDYRQGRYMWMHALAYRTGLVRALEYRQTEGISYTDQEWVAIPMMAARSFRRFPEPVYRYLVGREGQTVEPSVRLRNFSMHFDVQKAIINAWLQNRNVIPENNSNFVRELIDAHLRTFYTEYLILHPRAMNLSNLDSFDAYLANALPEAYRNLEALYLKFCRFSPPFRYVQKWRRHRSRQTFSFFLSDIVMRIRDRRRRKFAQISNFKRKQCKGDTEGNGNFVSSAKIHLVEQVSPVTAWHAGLKAPADIAAIVESMGFQTKRLFSRRPRNPIAHAATNILRFLDAVRIAFTTPRHAIVFVQYPVFSAMRPGLICLQLLHKWRHATVISLIHDIDALRGKGVVDESGIDLGLHFLLKVSDKIIVHNESMRAWLAKHGIPMDQMASLGIFDYLIPGFAPSPDVAFEKAVIIAGNLSSQKSPYLDHLKEIKDVKWRLFGPNYDEERLTGDNVSYGGSYSPEQIPYKLGNGFGLVWDGTDIDTCAGASGDYLRINNPHKLSLFLAAGVPVFIWAEAAEAEFVRSHGVGYAIRSMKVIPEILQSLNQLKYFHLRQRVLILAEKIRTGYFTRTALSKWVYPQ